MKPFFLIAIFLTPVLVHAQWIKQDVNTTASLRGLSVVNENVVWASGTGGTVVRTVDGGKTWNVIVVPGAEKLDFRDIEAFDANTAYILSIGNGDSSRIYKTTDGGKTWDLQFKNTNEKAFFDAMACWDKNNCIALSDPVDGKFPLIETANGCKTWQPVDTSKMPPAKDGEAAFAASGTCLITQGKTNAFLVTGGSAARVFRSHDRGHTWSVADTPIVHGTSGSGIFSISMLDGKNGVIVGGNYEKPSETGNNLAITHDGGKSWKIMPGLHGYRSGVTFVDSKTMIAVGISGTDVSSDAGTTWLHNNEKAGDVTENGEIRLDGDTNLNSVQAKGKNAIWAVGPNGSIAQQFDLLKFLNITLF
jgi:photosystem II stability/assembly factor-like uncharacterized protein